jgi:hypothetical protein
MKFFDDTLDDTALILQLLIAGHQFVQVFLLFVLGLGQISDLLGELLELFLTALALGSSDTSFHLLDLEIGVVE